MRATFPTRRVLALLCASAIALSPLTARADQESSAAPDATPGVLWSGDVQSDGFARWNHVHDGQENAVNGNTAAQIVSAPGRPGRVAISLVDNAGTPGRADRAEVGNDPATNRGNDGQEAFYRFSVFFPNANRGNWAPNVWDHNNFFQFIGTDWAKPAMNLGINTGDFGTTSPHMFFNLNVAPNGSIDDRKGGRWDLGPVQYDSWVNFVIHVRWSANPGGGLLQAWMNGNEVVPLRTARTLGNAPVIMEIQNYRPNAQQTTVHMFDDVRIADNLQAAL